MPPKSPLQGRHVYVFGPFRMDVAERRLSREGGDISLTRKSFDLLLTLIEHAGRLRTRESLIGTLWPDTIVEEHNLTWNLSALRRALGDTGDAARYIETVRGHGYRFIAPVHDDEDGISSPRAPGPAVDAGGSTDESPARPADPAPSTAQGFAAFSGGTPVTATRVATLSPRATPHVLRFAFAGVGVLALVLAAAMLWRSGRERTPALPTSAPMRSVAVLPFENLSPDPANAYFASGIQDTILTKLAGIRDLRVVSRMSTDGYRSHPADLAQVLRQLDVASVLEGSVQRSGDEVLINVQLIDGQSGGHLWAQTYTRTLDKVFEVQSDVAGQVALALRAKLLPAEANRVAMPPTADAEAYDLFLKAEYGALQIESGSARTPAITNGQARGYYEQAVARDPQFALAFARLSYLENHAYWLDIDHTPARVAAGQRAAERALALDPELPQAHLAMGYSYYYGRRDYAAALVEFERAVRDLPNNADVNASIANIQRRRGQWTAALEGYEHAAVLDPRNPQWSILLGDSLTAMRRYDEADAAYDRARAIAPDNTSAALYKTLSQVMAGHGDRADATLAGMPRDVDPEGLGSAIRYVAAWSRNDLDDALAVLAAAPPSMDAPWTPGFVPTELLRAQTLEAKGDHEAAHRAYVTAREILTETLRTQPGNPATLSLLGLAQAGLGNKAAALDAGQRAVDVLTVADDAVDGPYYSATLAEIQLRVGHPAAAIPLLRGLLALPAGRVMSIGLIEHDPRYLAVREQLRNEHTP